MTSGGGLEFNCEKEYDIWWGVRRARDLLAQVLKEKLW